MNKKFTWGITAPSDEDLTPHRDEEGAISFNVWLTGKEKTVSLFIDPTTKKPKPIQLQNGQTHKPPKGAIVKYSPHLYETICIRFIKKPHTFRPGRGKKKIDETCNSIAVSSKSYENWANNWE